jgi:hypothetical protein
LRAHRGYFLALDLGEDNGQAVFGVRKSGSLEVFGASW